MTSPTTTAGTPSQAAIAAWLRQERQVRGWDVRQMARKLRDAAAMAGDTLPAQETLTVMIYRWEGDRSGVSERYRLHFCAAFQIPISQFGVPAALTLSASNHVMEQCTAAGPALLVVDQVAELAQPVISQVGIGLSGSSGDRSGHRCLMPGYGQSIGRHVLAAAYESSTHAQATERRDIGQFTLEHFRTTVIRLARESLTGEPVAMFFQMRGVRDRLHAAAGRQSWPADRHELYLLLGCMNSLMAATAQHIGIPAAAQELAIAGLTYATVLGHRPLTARLRLDLATIACQTGMLRDCLDHAATALEHVTDGPVADQLHLIRARAAAQLGDIGTARHAIAQANRASDRAAAADTVDIVSQIRFSPAARHYYAGAALLEIPSAGQDALAELERAVNLYQAATEPGTCHDHDYMTACADLAAARLRAGDLQAAEAAAEPVLALPCPRRVSGLAHSFIRVRAELGAPMYRDSPDAATFDGRIGLFCAHTIATHLVDARVTV